MERIGLVFCGGGAKGAYQIGVWEALRNLGVEEKIAAVSGDSVGALNAYLFSCENLAQAKNAWRFDATKNNLFNPLDVRFGEKFSRDGLRYLIKGLDDKAFLVSNRKTFISTLVNGKPRFHDISGYSKDGVTDFLLASSALPFINDPVVIQGEKHSDPGLFYNLPIEPIYKMGVCKMILVDLEAKSIAKKLAKFVGCEFIIIKPETELGSTLVFDRYQKEKLIERGFKDCIVKLTGVKTEMDYYKEKMERVFPSKDNIEEFCREYNKFPKFYTLGGKTFWNNLFEFDGYVIQQHMGTKVVRVLDEKNLSVASLYQEEFYKYLDDYENKLIARAHRRIHPGI